MMDAEAAANKRNAPPEKRKRQSVSGEAVLDRPSRDRKPVVRFIHNLKPRIPPPKLIKAKQGKGIKLKDIPNVLFNVSKRKTDETLQFLHKILFGRKSDAQFLKRNIFQFSGFVADEEKQKRRVGKILDKCMKNMLLDLSELLDIPIVAGDKTKKEELKKYLLEFLESPCKTRDILLTDYNMNRKRKRKGKGNSQLAPGESPEKELEKHKTSPKSDSKRRRTQSAKAKKGNESDGGCAENGDEGRGSADKEDSYEGSISNDGDKLSNAEKDDGTTKESHHAKSLEKGEGDALSENLTETNQSSEKQKGTQLKVKEKASPTKRDSVANFDKSPAKSVIEKASSDAEDVRDVLTSRKVSAKTLEEGGGDALSKNLTGTNRSSEKQKGTQLKVEENALAAKRDSVADSDNSPANSVPEKASSHAEDVLDVPTSRKMGSEDLISGLPKPDTKEKAVANQKDSVTSSNSMSKSSPKTTSLGDTDSGPVLSSKPKDLRKKVTPNGNPVPKDNS